MNKEEQWISEIKTKANREAANELVSKYYREIYAYVYKQTLDKELSMDLTQDVFISMLQSIGSYNGGKAAFRTWLYKIATNKLVDYYRSRYYKFRSIAVSIEDYELHDAEDFTICIQNKQEAQRIMNIINGVDSCYQSILRLKVYAEYTFLEISRMLGISEATVKTRYYSVIKKVKRVLEEGNNGQA